MEKTKAFVRLTRPPNCVMMGFAVVIGATLTGSKNLSTLWLNLAFGFLTGFMLTAASMAVNDYWDREIDAVNESKRPIPSGAVKPRGALAFAFFLTAAGFLAAYFTNLWCLLIAIVAMLISVAYTTMWKRSGLPGNFLVSACVAVPFIYGSIAVASLLKANVLIFAFIVFLSVTGREIAKGIVDVQGDRLRNVKTLPVRYGEKTAAIFAAIFFLFAVTALSRRTALVIGGTSSRHAFATSWATRSATDWSSEATGKDRPGSSPTST
jgi:geranylgeranylglycerol-phosphate geranylgeranyltransferase